MIKKTLVSLIAAASMLVSCNPLFMKGITKPDISHTEFFTEYKYDMNGDGRIDYIQEALHGGQKVRFHFDTNFDGYFEKIVNVENYTEETPHMTLILDAVTYDMMTELYKEGHFRLLGKPAKMVSTFPSSSDVAYSVIYKNKKNGGYEKIYYDTEKDEIIGNLTDYAFKKDVDQTLFKCDNPVLFWDYMIEVSQIENGMDLEMQQLKKAFYHKKGKDMVLYMRTTDLASHYAPKKTVKKKLIEISQLLEYLFYKAEGDMKITVYSDHGNNFDAEKTFSIEKILEKEYKLGESLKDSEVVLMSSGALSISTIYTHENLEEEIAQKLSGIKGIDLLAYRTGKELNIISKKGKAKILKKDNKFKYQPITGDPLELQQANDFLHTMGYLDSEGYATEESWFVLTTTQYEKYPDPLKRLWDSLSGEYVKNPASIIISLENGYREGSEALTGFLNMTGTHGALNKECTYGMFMTNYADSPSAIRAEDITLFIHKHHPKIDIKDHRD